MNGGEIVGFDDFCKNMMKDFGPHADWLYLENKGEIVGYCVMTGKELLIPKHYLVKKYMESLNSPTCKCCGR